MAVRIVQLLVGDVREGDESGDREGELSLMRPAATKKAFSVALCFDQVDEPKRVAPNLFRRMGDASPLGVPGLDENLIPIPSQDRAGTPELVFDHENPELGRENDEVGRSAIEVRFMPDHPVRRETLQDFMKLRLTAGHAGGEVFRNDRGHEQKSTFDG